MSEGVHITQLFDDGGVKRAHPSGPQLNGPASLAPSRPERPSAAGPDPAHHGRPGATAHKAPEGKAKPAASTPEQAMKQFMSKMSSFEHHEVFSYAEGERSPPPSRDIRRRPSLNSQARRLFCLVYFVGPNAKKRAGVLGGANNCGYDDEQGSYIQVPHDQIAYRYEVLKVIGKGSFGQVRTNRLAAPAARCDSALLTPRCARLTPTRRAGGEGV